MFCPQCGTLSFPTPSGDISCTNYKCGYNGPAKLKTKIGGKEVDLSKATSSTQVKSREYEVIKDSDKTHGVLTKEPTCVQNAIASKSSPTFNKLVHLTNQRHVCLPVKIAVTAGENTDSLSNQFPHVVQGSKRLHLLHR